MDNKNSAAESQMLRFQNQKLSEKLEVQRCDIHSLEEKIERMKTKQTNYEDNLGFVTRSWQELNEDVQLLTLRSTGKEDLNSFQRLDKKYENSADPFLERLLQNVDEKNLENSTSKHSIQNGFTNDVEETLSKLYKRTRIAFTKVLDALAESRLKEDNLKEKLRESLSDDGVRNECKSWQQEALIQRTALEKLHAQHRVLTQEGNKLRENLLKAETRVQELTGDLEASTDEVQNLTRKLSRRESESRVENSGPPGAGASGASGASGDKGRVGGDKSTPSKGDKVADKGAVQALQIQVRELEKDKEMLEARVLKREKECDATEADRLALKQELRRLKDDLASGSHVTSTKQFQALHERFQTLQTQNDEYRHTLQHLQREQDLAIIREREACLKVESGEAAERACRRAEGRAQDMETRLQQITRDRDLAKVNLHTALQEASNKNPKAVSADESQRLIDLVKKESKILKAEVESLRSGASQLGEVEGGKARAEAALQAEETRTQGLRADLARRCAEVEGLKAEVEGVRRCTKDLELFVQVITQACEGPPPQLAEAQARRKHAEEECEKLRTELKESSLVERRDRLQAEVSRSSSELSQVRSEASAVAAQLAALQGQQDRLLQQRRDQHQAYISEIQAIGGVCEDMQQQNTKLLGELREREEYSTQLLQEKLVATQQAQSLKEERDLAGSKVATSEQQAEEAALRIQALHHQLQQTLEQLRKAVEEAHTYNALVEEQKRALESQKQAMEEKRGEGETTTRCLAETRSELSECQVELEKERGKRKRQEEDVQHLRAKVDRIHQSHAQGTGSTEIVQELKMYKDLLKCQVCHDRRKEVVLSKCFHLFCRPCITKNLEIRHRKCPACGIAFGQADVHSVYM